MAAASRRSRAPRRCSSRCGRRHGDALTLRRVVAMALEGDLGCRRVIHDAGRALGLAVAGTCNLLAPEQVVVGGELARAGDRLLAPVRDVAGRAAIAATRRVPVTAGVLGERAEVLGAVALVLRESQRFVAEPEPPAGAGQTSRA